MINYGDFLEEHKGMEHAPMVIAFLDQFGSITSMDAFHLGITRLAAVVFRLNHGKDGEYLGRIKTVMINNGKSRYARYMYEEDLQHA